LRNGGDSVEDNLRAALQRAIAVLDDNEYAYAVIGGIAVQRLGRSRYTHDIDLKVLIPDTDYDPVRDLIRSAFPERGRPELPQNPLIVDVRIGGVIVDFLLTLPGYEEAIVERAACHDLDGLEVWICSAEDLIVQKAAAGRPKDWDDIEGVLIEQHGRLDMEYVNHWIEQFAEALADSEMLRQFRQVLERLAKARERADRIVAGRA
jgi:predicted nucleotidyltransferase